MTTEEKLQHFMEITVNTAAAKCQDMVEEYKAGMDKISEDHKAEAEKKAETLKMTTKDGIRRNSSKEFARQQQQIKRTFTKKQEELKDKLFEEVLELLHAYKATPSYQELLIRQIKDSLALAKDLEIHIYIDPEDADKLKALEQATGADISIQEFSFLGGMCAEIPAKNILIDNSFASKFASAKEEFIIDIN